MSCKNSKLARITRPLLILRINACNLTVSIFSFYLSLSSIAPHCNVFVTNTCEVPPATARHPGSRGKSSPLNTTRPQQGSAVTGNLALKQQLWLQPQPCSCPALRLQVRNKPRPSFCTFRIRTFSAHALWGAARAGEGPSREVSSQCMVCVGD